MELCHRLGIRYVSITPSERPTPHTESSFSAQMEQANKTFDGKEQLSSNIPSPATDFDSSQPETPADMDGKPHWLTASPDTIQAMELRAFDRDICECQNCPLGKTRKKFVFGSGNPAAEVLFVGEAPGADEDAQGLPFVGRAGQLLTKIIESTKMWKRSDVFICNVLKCRPPGNRTPLPEEIEQCLPYLEEQIHIIKPRLIMALGATASQALLRTKVSVGKLRGKWHEFEGIPLRVTYHPSALLRFEGYKKDVWEDMKELTAKYEDIKSHPNP